MDKAKNLPSPLWPVFCKRSDDGVMILPERTCAMREKIKNMTISWVILSVLYVLLGISLAVWPSFVMSVICYAFGAILLLYGAFVICGFYRGKEHKAISLLTLFLGIVSAALGAMMIIYPAKVLLFYYAKVLKFENFGNSRFWMSRSPDGGGLKNRWCIHINMRTALPLYISGINHISYYLCDTVTIDIHE